MESAYEATFTLTELRDNYSAEQVEKAMMQIEGVHQVSIDTDDHEVTVVYEDDKVRVEDLKEAASSAGCTIEQARE